MLAIAKISVAIFLVVAFSCSESSSATENKFPAPKVDQKLQKSSPKTTPQAKEIHHGNHGEANPGDSVPKGRDSKEHVPDTNKLETRKPRNQDEKKPDTQENENSEAEEKNEKVPRSRREEAAKAEAEKPAERKADATKPEDKNPKTKEPADKQPKSRKQEDKEHAE